MSNRATAKTVLFDLDGTLTDPAEGITACIRHALERLGADTPDDDLLWCIGPPLLESFQSLLGDQQRAEEALALYRERFGSIGLYENRLYPGILALMQACQFAGFRTFVATSKPTIYAVRITEYFGLSPFFDAIHGAELDGIRSDKTELLAWICEQHNIAPTTAIMVGDRRHDIIGARNNGLETIGVTYGYGSAEELLAAGATRLAASAEEVAAHLGL